MFFLSRFCTLVFVLIKEKKRNTYRDHVETANKMTEIFEPVKRESLQ